MCAGTGEPPTWRLSLSTGTKPFVRLKTYLFFFPLSIPFRHFLLCPPHVRPREAVSLRLGVKLLLLYACCRARKTASVRQQDVPGVVSDAVPCLFNGVICDLPFNVVGLPKKTGGMIAHHSMICQSLHATFCGGKNGSPNRNITECSLSARSRRFAALLCALCVLCGSTVFRCIRESCNNYEEPSRTMRHMYKMVFQHVQARFPA